MVGITPGRGCDIFFQGEWPKDRTSPSTSRPPTPSSEEDQEYIAFLSDRITQLRKRVPKPQKSGNSFEERYHLSCTYEQDPKDLADPVSVYRKLYSQLIKDVKISRARFPVFIKLENPDRWEETIISYFKLVLVYHADPLLDKNFPILLNAILTSPQRDSLNPEHHAENWEEIFRYMILHSAEKSIQYLKDMIENNENYFSLNKNHTQEN